MPCGRPYFIPDHTLERYAERIGWRADRDEIALEFQSATHVSRKTRREYFSWWNSTGKDHGSSMFWNHDTGTVFVVREEDGRFNIVTVFSANKAPQEQGIGPTQRYWAP